MKYFLINSSLAEVVALSDAADKPVEAGESGIPINTFDRNPNNNLGFV